MNHGSLFSGIGGFDLAAEWMGWTNVFHCEWNEFGQKILKYYWPNAISYGDITKTDFTIWRGRIDVLTGGFPCQPFSMAGKRKGTEDERHLWPEMLRVIREIKPTWVVGENVFGLTNWDGGLVFEQVQADLEAEGYEVQPYVLPACAVNAPHRRDRVWFVAHATNNGYERGSGNSSGNGSRESGSKEIGKRLFNKIMSDGADGATADTQSSRDRGELRGLAEEDEGKRQPEECRQDNVQYRDDGSIGASADTSITGREEWQQNRGRQDAEKVRAGMDNRPERHGNIRVIADTKSTGTGQDIRGLRSVSDRHSEGIQDATPYTRLLRPQGAGEQTAGVEQCDEGDVADTSNQGLERSEIGRGIRSEWEKSHKQPSRFIRPDWQNFPTVSPLCDRNDGLSDRLSGITFSKWRNESIKAMGNAIVPQVVYQIFKAIEQYERLNP